MRSHKHCSRLCSRRGPEAEGAVEEEGEVAEGWGT